MNTACPTLKKNASIFLLKNLQRVRFWIDNFLSCQILNGNFTQCQILNWWKTQPFRVWVYLFTTRQFSIRPFLCCQILTQKRWNVLTFELKALHCVRFWNEKIFVRSDFDLRTVQLVVFWINNSATCHILYWEKKQGIRFGI